MKNAELERIRLAAAGLRAAESGVRVLRTLSWSPRVRDRFFAHGARELPVVSYPRFDPQPVHEQLHSALRGVGQDGPIDSWLRRSAASIGSAAELLAAIGTLDFLEHGARLFGLPATVQGGRSPLALARTVDAMCAELSGLDLGAPPPACHSAEEIAVRMRQVTAERFGDQAPEIVVVEELSANALAGPRRIQVRRDARFTDRDVHQLIQHEAFIHVCTFLNGREQLDLPLLAAAHPGTTRTQEGLAVFAEFITGTLEPDRFRRLADRVLAIQMSIEGADFLEVYRFFLERGVTQEQAFENARRVFRGGLLSGGAPFTKDTVYLDGFLRVTNFLRAVAAEARVDCLLLLFCGKLDLEDIPALAQLTELGLCRAPRFLPPWASDRRFLVTYLTYSTFLNGIRLDDYRHHYRALLAETPVASAGRAPAGLGETAVRHSPF